MFWSALTLVVWLLVVSCTQTAPPPPVPPPPEDLSTWTVPALVQPLTPEPPALSGQQEMPNPPRPRRSLPMRLAHPIRSKCP